MHYHEFMKVTYVKSVEVNGLGNAISQARRKLKAEEGRSLRSLCKDVGLSPQGWYQIEREDNDSIPLETLRAIERVLGVDFGVNLA